MTYANHECVDCHKILPANQMVQWRSSDHTSSSYSTGTPGSRRERISYRSLWVCRPCARARRKIRSVLFLLCVVVIAAVVGYSFLSSQSRLSTSTTAGAFLNQRDKPNDGLTTLARKESRGANGKASNEDKQMPAPVTANASAPIDPPSESHEEIDEAIKGALNADASVAWKADDGRSGYAIAGEPRQYGSQECKSYRYTVVRPGTSVAWTSPDGVACRAGGGDWELDAEPNSAG